MTLAVVWEPVAVDLATRFLADDPEGLRDLFEAVDALARSQDVGQAYAHQRKLLEMGRA